MTFIEKDCLNLSKNDIEYIRDSTIDSNVYLKTISENTDNLEVIVEQHERQISELKTVSESAKTQISDNRKSSNQATIIGVISIILSIIAIVISLKK